MSPRVLLTCCFFFAKSKAVLLIKALLIKKACTFLYSSWVGGRRVIFVFDFIFIKSELYCRCYAPL